jgi:two-component system sensor histidine kinase DevS
MTIRRPSFFFAIGLVALLLFLILTAHLAMRLPRLGITVESEPSGSVQITGMSQRPAQLALPARLIAVEADDRVVPVGGDMDAVRRTERGMTWGSVAAQDDLTRVTSGRSIVHLRIRGSDGRAVTVARPVHHMTLRWPFWINGLSGLLGATIALGIFVLRPHEDATKAIALSGLGLCLAALPFAILQNAEFVVGGTLWRALVAMNWASALLFGAGLILFFALFPKRLINRPIVRLCVLALTIEIVGVALAGNALLIGYGTLSALICLDFMIIVVLVVAQWRRAAADPVTRAGIRLVGSVTVITLALFLSITMLPATLGTPFALADYTSFLQMLPTYGAIALSVTRGQMFDLDRWSWRMAASATTLLLLLAIDMVLVLAAGIAAASALSVALLLVSAVWIVVRQRLFDRMFHTPREHGAKLFGMAGHVAMAIEPAEQFVRWKRSLADCFAPLEIDVTNEEVSVPQVRDGGLTMLVPPPPFGHALRLSAAQSGRGLFNAEDCAITDLFAQLCEQAEVDRRAYDRGMREERGRIARDLHDDISGRLLTSLHRTDPEAVQSDVRGALQEIRLLVAGLQGERRTIGEMIATLRYDCSERLGAAGIMLAWPLKDLIGADQPIAYVLFKTIDRAVREAITNVIRHAGASQVTVSCSLDPLPQRHRLTIVIADNGCGISPVPRQGNGLKNICARMAEIGGSADISGAAGGTRITLNVMLEGTG